MLYRGFVVFLIAFIVYFLLPSGPPVLLFVAGLGLGVTLGVAWAVMVMAWARGHRK